MRVLVACEFSGTVRDAFIAAGHDAWSCDLDPCFRSPHWRRHLEQDVRPLLRERWDLIIAHPPCTYLCQSGVRWLHEKEGRWEQMLEGVQFFLECLLANSSRVAVENPPPHKYAVEYVGRPTQTVRPWMFGNPEVKPICLWLRGLPQLQPTKVISGRRNDMYLTSGGEGKGKLKSIFFPEVAQAMAAQWRHLG